MGYLPEAEEVELLRKIAMQEHARLLVQSETTQKPEVFLGEINKLVRQANRMRGGDGLNLSFRTLERIVKSMVRYPEQDMKKLLIHRFDTALFRQKDLRFFNC